MQIKFSKMHGLGNDFMVVDTVTQKVFFSTDLIKRLGDRHFGVGFDQLLLIEPPYNPDFDFHYRIFNQDGSEVQMCGNGARCFARYVLDPWSIWACRSLNRLRFLALLPKSKLIIRSSSTQRRVGA